MSWTVRAKWLTVLTVLLFTITAVGGALNAQRGLVLISVLGAATTVCAYLLLREFYRRWPM